MPNEPATPVTLEASHIDVALPDRSKKPLFGRPPLLGILHDVSLRLAPGEAVGVVGESGSGKSTLGRTLLRLWRPARGRIVFEGTDITDLAPEALRPLRARMQMIFQDSQSALNPRQTIGEILALPFIAIAGLRPRAARERAHALLARVNLAPEIAARYPHQLSGGQRQRVGIARAISLEPSFVVADEIVSGLDVSVQAQILDLLRRLRAESRMAMVFISHDLSVVRNVCDRVLVMQQGRIVEEARAAELFAQPKHPYTRTLLRAIPLPVVNPDWLARPEPDEGG